MFRFCEKEDSETFDRSFIRKKTVEPTQDPRIFDKDKRQEQAIAPSTPARAAIDAPTADRATRKSPSMSPTEDANVLGKRTPPTPGARSPAPKKTKISGSSSITAGLVEALETEDAKADPKKFAANSEKALKACVLSWQSTVTQSREVADNVNDSNLEEWTFLKTTPYFPKFQEAIKDVNEFKARNPMLKSLLLTDCDFGHKSVWFLNKGPSPFPRPRALGWFSLSLSERIRTSENYSKFEIVTYDFTIS